MPTHESATAPPLSANSDVATPASLNSRPNASYWSVTTVPIFPVTSIEDGFTGGAAAAGTAIANVANRARSRGDRTGIRAALRLAPAGARAVGQPSTTFAPRRGCRPLTLAERCSDETRTPPGVAPEATCTLHGVRIGEALSKRADAQKRIAQLGARLESSAVVQEGDTPPEDPARLLAGSTATAVLEPLITAST